MMAPMMAAAGALGLRLSQLDVKSVKDFETPFAAAKKSGAECIVLVESPRAVANRALIGQLGLAHRLPVTSQFSRIVETDLSELFRRVDKILRGAAPGEPPVEQPSKFELVSVQLRVDRIIE